jgi:hypothetical protein
MDELRTENTSERWRLFTDSHKVNVKALLLHSGMLPSIPLAHAVHIIETYKKPSGLLQKKNTLRKTPVEYMC